MRPNHLSLMVYWHTYTRTHPGIYMSISVHLYTRYVVKKGPISILQRRRKMCRLLTLSHIPIMRIIAIRESVISFSRRKSFPTEMVLSVRTK